MSPLHHKKSLGIALVAVLCLVTLLAVIALGAMEATRRHAQLARRSFDLIQSQELVDSAIRLVILELSATTSGSQNNVTERTFDVFDRSVSVRYEYESGRIDLNFADRDLLMAFFAANQFSEIDASRFADRIIDWRDADDERGSQGAERSDYQQAGQFLGPRNGPFETVSEFMQVLEAEKLGTEFLDAFTVYSHSSSIAENTATPAAIRALRWADRRQLGGHGWITDQPSMAPHSLAGETIRLRGCSAYSNGELCRIAVVRFTGSPQEPVQVLSWQTAYASAATVARGITAAHAVIEIDTESAHETGGSRFIETARNPGGFIGMSNWALLPARQGCENRRRISSVPARRLR